MNKLLYWSRYNRIVVFPLCKLWNSCHRPDLVEPAIRETLKNLGLDYVDLYLIHWPVGFKEEAGLWPRDENEKILFTEVDYVDTWKAMEELVNKGLAKSIGISNFNSEQIERILSSSTIVPAVNQVILIKHLKLSLNMRFIFYI